ncbi:hypothetical protein C8Q74DRAFT_1199274 [Fomes fomentarius]|nr:hypothetical protein C8Q74DRAFT_1199274 [Fomes fomentarius]
MALSTTTTTATYEIAKYSRAYSHSTNPASLQTELEWQHFANPVIRLIMDTKKTPEGHLASFRLRVVWTFSAGANSMDVDEREIVFEDMDLVTYSAMPSFQAPQGMPLKAVYQGAVVGLRYQYPRIAPPGQAPQYRRFQVTFHTEAAATAFIDSIRFICPCKANSGPPARIPRPTQVQAQAQSQTQYAQTDNRAHIAISGPRTPVSSSLRQAASTMAVDPSSGRTSPPPAKMRRTTTALTGFTSWDSLPSGPLNTATADSTITGTRPLSYDHDHDSSSSHPSSSVTASSVIAHHSFSDLSARASNSACLGDDAAASSRPPSQRGRKEIFACRSSSDIDSSLPSSSLPSSSPPRPSRPLPRSPELMPPPPVPPQASFPRSSQTTTIATQTPTSSNPGLSGTKDQSLTPGDRSTAKDGRSTIAASESTLHSDIAASLKDSAGLYKLSKKELEILVAGVIREEGFAELMSALDGMWKIKGLAGVLE